MSKGFETMSATVQGTQSRISCLEVGMSLLVTENFSLFEQGFLK
jgi:hypothetical protein